MSISKQIRHAIQGIPPGEPFAATRFLELGSRAAVDQELYRLARQGAIHRVARGVYARPEVSSLFGEVPVAPVKIATERVRATGGQVQISGAEAANRLGLSTQVPMQSMLLTSGYTRTMDIGGRSVILRHAGKRAMVGAGTPAGPVVSALYYLGKSSIGKPEVQVLKERLSAEELESVRQVIPQVPAWMSDVLRRIVAEQLAPCQK
jgi:hypothetical protein